MRQTPCWPNYSASSLNLISALLRRYGVGDTWEGLSGLEGLLGGEKLLLLVLDGLGQQVLERHLAPDGFLRRNLASTLSAVYPCTTTAAMTTYYSGLSPLEHGWLGWSLFFREYGRMLDTFLNRDSLLGQVLPPPSAAFRLMPYTTIFERIGKAAQGQTRCVFLHPTGMGAFSGVCKDVTVDRFEDLCQAVVERAREPGQSFLFAYWPEPDATMHLMGPQAQEAGTLLRELERRLRALSAQAPGLQVLVTADHGMAAMERQVMINDCPELDECLLLPPSVESRAASFHVRPDRKEAFCARFEERLGDAFILLSRQQVLDSGLLGPGTPHKKTLDFLGDYLACATGGMMLGYRMPGGKQPVLFKGQHAGLTPEEMRVPLIAFKGV